HLVAEPLLQTRGLVKRFGGVVASDRVDLAVQAGEIHAVIRPHGAGKTTPVAPLAGGLVSDAGPLPLPGGEGARPAPRPRAARGLARSFQITSILAGHTALDNVALAVQARAGHSFRFWRPVRTDPTLRDPARAVLVEVGLAERAEVLAARLAHGEQRQLEIAMALATRPPMLLLDEPMAGLAREEAMRMVALLRELRSRQTLLLVEHDMDAVFALADRISVLVYGRLIATGSPAEIRANDEVARAYLGDDDRA